jgi:hypothetical protein
VKHVGSLADVQRFGDLATRMLPRLANHFARMPVSARVDFVRDILHGDEVRLRTQVGHEGAASGNALDVTLIVQLAKRAIRRHARDVHGLH